MRKGTVWILIGLLLLAAAGAAIYTIRDTGGWLNYVLDSRLMPDGTVYVIDSGDRKVRVLQLDSEGRVRSLISIPQIVQGNLQVLDYLSVDDDGTVYVYQRQIDILNNRVAEESIYRCNFEQGILEPAWNLKLQDTKAQNYFRVVVRDQAAYYFASAYDETFFKAQAVLYKYPLGGEPEVVSITNYDLGVGYSDFYYAANGERLFLTPDSDLVFENGSGQAIPIYPHNYASTEIVNFAGDGANKLYITDLKRQEILCFDLVEDTITTYANINDIFAEDSDRQYSDLKNVRFTSDGRFTAGVYEPDGRLVLGIFDATGVQKIISRIQLPAEMYAGTFFTALGLILAGMFLLWLLYLIYLYLSGGKVSIVVKQAAAFIPIIVIVMLVMQHFIDQTFTDEMIKNQNKELFLISTQQINAISPELLSEIDIERPFDEVYYYDLRQIVNALPANAEIYSSSKDEKEPQIVNNLSYYWLYRVENGKLRTLFCDQMVINLPIEYMYHRDVVKTYYQAVEQKRVTRTSFKDVMGDWIVVLTPIMDRNGNVVALLETGTTKASLSQVVQANTRDIARINLGAMGAMLFILLGMLFVSLSPLKRLKSGVQAITNGELGVQVEARGRDEIAEIAGVFNNMSSHIQNQVDELTDLSEGYYKFVPAKMFEMLRRSSVTDVHLGDQTKADITIMTFNAVDFDEMVSEMTAEQMFTMINHIFSNLIPIISKYDGVVDRFVNAGMVVFFTEGSEAALNSAVSLSQRMDILNAERSLGTDRTVAMTTAISHGPVMIGIVGHERRLSATTISEHANLTTFLRRIAPKYYSRILTTGSALKDINDFEGKYNARFIGFLYLRSNQTVEKLYDVFDGDKAEVKYLKRQTKALFEKGVALFCVREFYEARLVFIEVLKQFRDDAAAKEYLYRCDQYYQSGDKDMDIYIEQY